MERAQQKQLASRTPPLPLPSPQSPHSCLVLPNLAGDAVLPDLPAHTILTDLARDRVLPNLPAHGIDRTCRISASRARRQGGEKRSGAKGREGEGETPRLDLRLFWPTCPETESCPTCPDTLSWPTWPDTALTAPGKKSLLVTPRQTHTLG